MLLKWQYEEIMEDKLIKEAKLVLLRYDNLIWWVWNVCQGLGRVLGHLFKDKKYAEVWCS